jgi:hypothetical protein
MPAVLHSACGKVFARRQVDGDELIDHDGRTILASGAQFSSEVDGAIIDADGGRLIFRPARKTLDPRQPRDGHDAA